MTRHIFIILNANDIKETTKAKRLPYIIKLSLLKNCHNFIKIVENIRLNF